MSLAQPIVVNLREEGKRGARDLGVLPALSDIDRRAAIETWRGRMVNEHISARVFAGLVPQLMRAGVAAKWQERAAAAATEELRHGRQCAAVVHALGGDPYAEIAQLEELPTHADVGALEAALRNVLSISCLSETVAVALISAERSRCGVPGIGETLDRILADEVRHARSGWAMLEELAPSMEPALMTRLSAYLTVAFRHLVAHELAHLPLNAAPSEQAAAVGVCDGVEARALFFDTVETVIIPRLESLGFAAERAWSAAQGARRRRQEGRCARA